MCSEGHRGLPGLVRAIRVSRVGRPPKGAVVFPNTGGGRVVVVAVRRPRWVSGSSSDQPTSGRLLATGKGRSRGHPLEVVGAAARCEIAGAGTLSTITLRH